MPGKRWVPREKESLIRQVKQGKRLPQIRISGRSPAGVNQQRQRLRNAGLLGEVPKRRLRMWTTKEIRSLREHVSRSRLSARQIARAGLLAGRGKDSISQQMRRQGLGDPKRQEASRSAHRLDAKEKVALERFLRIGGRKLASGEVADKFEISPKTVTAYRRRLKLQLSWHEARSSERYRQRMEELRRVFVHRLRTRWKKWRVERRSTRIIGPFGDVTTYGNGQAYLSWYPAGLAGLADDGGLPKKQPLDQARLIADTLAGLGLDRSMLEEPDALWEVRGGYIVADGYGDIDDPRSPLHDRSRPGAYELAPGYFSVDTGKYSLGPMMASRTARLVRGSSRGTSQMKSGPLSNDWVTVLVPAYRPGAPFMGCLESLAAQTHPRVKVRVSLDYAPDHSLPELPALPHLILHRQSERLGWVGNVNWLLGRIDTPYAMVLSHDDQLSPSFIAEAAAVLKQRPEVVVVHGEVRYFRHREGEVAFTPGIRGDRLSRVLEFIERGPHLAELGWRGVARASAFEGGVHLRARRSDGMFSNTLWALELIIHGESEGLPQIRYEKYTDPVHGLSRDYHRRTARKKSAMLADNLACLVDVLGQAEFSEDERHLIVSRYAEWMLALQGNWNVISEEPDSDPLTYPELRPALAEFLAHALVSMAETRPKQWVSPPVAPTP